MPEISSAVDAGESCSTPSRIVTESRDRDRAGRRRVPSRDAGRVVRVHDLASRLHGGLRVGLVVLVDDLDGVVGAGFLRRRIDLIDRQLRGLAARRAVVRQVAGQRHDVADRQVERLFPTAAAVVATRGQAECGGEHEACDQERHDSCSPQSPSSLSGVTWRHPMLRRRGPNATGYRKAYPIAAPSLSQGLYEERLLVPSRLSAIWARTPTPRIASPAIPGRVLRQAGRPEHDEQAHSGGESEEDPHGRGSLPVAEAGRGGTLSLRKARTSSRPASSVGASSDCPHQPAADDHAVRDLAHRGDLLRRPDPESDRDRNVGRRAHPLHHLAELGRQRRALAGDPCHRHHVDETSRRLRDPPHLVGRRGRSDERDQRDAGLVAARRAARPPRRPACPARSDRRRRAAAMAPTARRNPRASSWFA